MNDLKWKVKSKKIKDLLNEEKLELKKMFLRKLIHGVNPDILISSIYEKSIKEKSENDIFDILEL